MEAKGFQVCDLHTHTVFSDGRLTPREVAEIALDYGYGVGVADHCGQGDFQLEDNQRFDQYLEALSSLPVYVSAELDLGNTGSVTPDRLARCHYLIGGVHSLKSPKGDGRQHFFDPEAEFRDPDSLIDRILEQIEIGAREHCFHILAHPGLLPMGMRDRAEFLLGEKWEKGLIGLALEYGFALEISSRWELPGRRLIEKAQQAGVRFSLGSDGHSRERMCRLDYSLRMVEACDIRGDQIYQPAIPATSAKATLSLTSGPTVSFR